jgi:alpha-ribazole phosphatase
LAQFLFPKQDIQYDNRLKEIHCGEWELQPWDAIDRKHIDAWMSDFVNVCIPGGESYVLLYQRVVEFFEEKINHPQPTAIVAHGGVLRSLLSYINKIELKESFDTFQLRYGCVVKLHIDDSQLKHTVLHNPESEKEQHRPAFY